MTEKKKVVKSSNIIIEVGLDKDNIPSEISWKASDDSGEDPAQECKGMLLSLFDSKSRDTLKIDLWTKEMQVQEMDMFFYQTLRSLGDTYFKATQNQKLASDMQKFVQYFGEETNIVKKGS